MTIAIGVVDRIEDFIFKGFLFFEKVQQAVCRIAGSLLKFLSDFFEIIFQKAFATFHRRTITKLNNMDKTSKEFKKAFNDHAAALHARFIKHMKSMAPKLEKAEAEVTSIRKMQGELNEVVPAPSFWKFWHKF